MLNATCRTILVCKLSQNVNSDGLTLLKALVLANWERVIMLVPNKPVCYIWTADKDANESDPRSNVYYFSSSDNKAWKKFRPWMKVILAVMCTTWAVVKIRPEKKIQACTEFEPMTSVIPVQCSTNWVNKPTGSRLLCWFQINPWSDE